jgi:ADP-ribosylglycohydrolase
MTALPADHDVRLDRVRLAIDGLSLGDSFGQHFFYRQSWADSLSLSSREIPPAPWIYTDDTEMALGVAETLDVHGTIDQDHLAGVFSRRYGLNPYRGYGVGAHDIFSAIARGEAWRTAAKQVFDGQGSLGNGGAMRVAPIGAYFAEDGYERVAEQARLSAEVTHTHNEGIAGAIAVATAAAWAVHRGTTSPSAAAVTDFFTAVLELTPAGDTRSGIERAAKLPLSTWQFHAAEQLGNGGQITAADTVPFCLWVAARHFDDFTEALWTTVHVGGDIDTNCAIIGGILALAVGRDGLPGGWLRLREPLVWKSGRD